jgi:hypothetical protein
LASETESEVDLWGVAFAMTLLVGLDDLFDLLQPRRFGGAVDRVGADAVVLVGVEVLVELAGDVVPFAREAIWRWPLADDVHDMLRLLKTDNSGTNAKIAAELQVDVGERAVEQRSIGELRSRLDEVGS